MNTFKELISQYAIDMKGLCNKSIGNAMLSKFYALDLAGESTKDIVRDLANFLIINDLLEDVYADSFENISDASFCGYPLPDEVVEELASNSDYCYSVWVNQ